MWEQLIRDINVPEVTWISSAFKLLLSMVLGSVVGYERKRKGQIAGVRTFSLICMGATLAMIISIYVPQVYLGLKNGDPSRIAAQVVSGIGFLGAGAIIQMKGSVRGLTTAAGIWMIAAIGMAVGVGLYVVSVIATLLILFILLQLERIEHMISLGSESRTISLSIGKIVHDITPYRNLLKENKVTRPNYYIAFADDTDPTRINLVVLAKETVDFMSVFEKIRQLNPTHSVSLTNQANI